MNTTDDVSDELAVLSFKAVGWLFEKAIQLLLFLIIYLPSLLIRWWLSSREAEETRLSDPWDDEEEGLVVIGEIIDE